MLQNTFSLVDIEYFLLVLVRIATFIFIAPVFSIGGIPNQAKIGLSCILSILVVTSVHPTEIAYYSLVGYSILMLKEAITGALIGFAAYVCNAIILFAGNMIDVDMGISMATEFDPTMRTQVTITGNLYLYFMFLMMMVTDMFQYLIRAVTDSFSVIPLGGAVFEPDTLLVSFTGYMTNVFVIGFRIFLPVFATILIVNCVLGIMAKVAQQLNMFSVGIQIKILVGLAVVYLTIFLFPEVCNYVFEQMSILVRSMVEGMH